MTNKIFSACMIIIMLAIITGGCSKNDINDPKEPAKVQKYHMVINAVKAQDNPANTPRRVLGLDGNTLNASWAVGEEVTVYNETKNTAISGVLTAQSNGAASTTLSGDLTGSIEPSDVLTLKFLSPYYTGQDGTLEYISANCDYAEASVIVASVSGGNITSTADAVFENKQAIVKFTLIDKADGSTLLNPTTLTINDGTNDIVTLSDIPTSTYTTNGDGVLYVAMQGFTDKTITLTAIKGVKTYSYEKSHVTFSNGQYYTISMKMTKGIPLGALSGEFAISPTLSIRFSKGNLQYKANTNIWRFAEHQYDMIGNGNCNISDTYDDWIDLFGFGTGDNPTISSTNSSDYSTFVDWGKNAISNGGNTDNLWRTLKGEEWGYIFQSRANAASLFGFGRVNGVDGLIILPDEWTLPDGLTFNASTSLGLEEQGEIFVNNSKNNYSHNSYTAEQWAIMEYYGAVFLPAAGDRNGTDLEMIGPGGYGNGGHYWSAVPYDADYSYDLNFNNKNFKPNFYQGVRMLGESVRLVLDVE